MKTQNFFREVIHDSETSFTCSPVFHSGIPAETGSFEKIKCISSVLFTEKTSTIYSETCKADDEAVQVTAW